MKKIVLLLFLFLAVQALALDKSLITVQDTVVNNGVLIVSVTQAGRPFALQCNQAASFCEVPKPGTYWMVRLPKNRGLYDCTDVDLYPQSVNPETGDKVGEYCLNEK